MKKEKYRDNYFKTSKVLNKNEEEKKESRRFQAMSRVKDEREQHRIKGQQEYRSGLKEIDDRINLSKQKERAKSASHHNYVLNRKEVIDAGGTQSMVVSRLMKKFKQGPSTISGDVQKNTFHLTMGEELQESPEIIKRKISSIKRNEEREISMGLEKFNDR